MFFVVRWNDSFNFPLGLIKYIVIVVIVIVRACMGGWGVGGGDGGCVCVCVCMWVGVSDILSWFVRCTCCFRPVLVYMCVVYETPCATVSHVV